MRKLLLIPLFVLPLLVTAQRYTVSSQLYMEVFGTSTLHDWEMESKKGSGYADINFTNGELKDVSALTFKMAVKTLKSGKGAMDDIAYEALKADKHETITYKLQDIISITKRSDDSWLIKAKGNLTIAGYTKSEILEVNAVKSGSTFYFSGDLKIKMTDYKMDPPTAMFGTIKTGDDLTLKWKVPYSGGEGL